LHAHNCGFISKSVTADGKYRKGQKNIHFYLINPIPGNPGPISRERGNGKIVGKSGTGNPGNETQLARPIIIIFRLLAHSVAMVTYLTFSNPHYCTVFYLTPVFLILDGG
jgi:hypothetical protein